MTSNAQPGKQLEVLFVGRANVDLTVRVPHLPGPSQTVFGSPLLTTAGGKSLNQAITASRLSGRAGLLANVGDDHWGQYLKRTLIDADVNVTHLRLLPDVATGAAIVEVTPDGENHLILALSPATELTAGQVHNALAQTTPAVITVQLDMPPEPVVTALTETPAQTLRVGNLVPHPNLGRDILGYLDVLVINQHEAATILGVPHLDPVESARQLRQFGPKSVVVTAGATGAAYSNHDRTEQIRAAPVPVVDTTGAGDAFLGCLTLKLSRDVALPDAVANAVRVGTLAVQHQGTHPEAAPLAS